MNTCFGCTSDGLQGSDYSDCWKCNHYSLYDEDDEFTEIKKQIRENAINECINEIDKVGWIESDYFIDLLEKLKENK